MKTKKDINYSFEHTKKRLKERYNTDIERKHYDILCDKIKQKKDITLIEIEFQKNDKQYVYDISFKHANPIRVVWSEARQCVTTVIKRG